MRKHASAPGPLHEKGRQPILNDGLPAFALFAGSNVPLEHACVLDEPFELGLRHGTHGTCNGLATLHDDERWDRLDAKLAGKQGLGVGVALAHLEFAGVLVGNLGNDGGDDTARAAPGCPKVNEHGHVGIEDFLFEVGCGQGNLGHGNSFA